MLTEQERGRIKRDAITPFTSLGVGYYGSLPSDLADWHVYILQAGIGHRILVCRPEDQHKQPIERHLGLIPVRTVLRLGYEVDDRGIVIVDLPMKRRAAEGDQAGYAELVPDFPDDEIERGLMPI
jgi:hypothetical protein